MSCADQAILDQNLTLYLQVSDTTGAPADADALPTYSVYEDETGTAILTGTMSKLDDSGTTGFYSEQIATSSDNGFELHESYTVRYSGAQGGTSLAAIDSFMVVETALPTTSGALTTVTNFKAYVGITGTDDDSLITALIARATSAIQAYCGQTLLSTTYREFRDGMQDRYIWLKETPVTSVQMVSLGLEDAISVTNTSSDAYNAHATVDDTNLDLTVQGGTNAGTDTLTLASYTFTELVAAINALGTGWAAVLLLSDYGVWESIELIPLSGLGALDTKLANLTAPRLPESGYRLEKDTGGLYFASTVRRSTQTITVRYTAGYATTPADLEQICIDLVNTYYLSRTRDTSLLSEKLGDHTVKFASDSGQGSVSYRDIPNSLKTRLAPYWSYRLPV